MAITEHLTICEPTADSQASLPLGTNPDLTEWDKALLESLGLSTEKLATFESPGVLVPEALGISLTLTKHPITLWTDNQTSAAGEAYINMLGIPPSQWNIQEKDNPVKMVQQPDNAIGLVVRSATDPKLKDQMFNNTGLQLFADGIYLPVSGFAGPHLLTIGISNIGAHMLNDELVKIQQHFNPDELTAARSELQKRFLAPNHLTNWQVRQILRSNKVQNIPAHALGPDGTNISQAMRLWIKQVGIKNKSQLIIHPAGIEPLGDGGSSSYAEIAAQQVAARTVPTHMECAVYYNQPRLWNERGLTETIFMDSLNMPLDNMLVAGPNNLSQLSAKGSLTIATHKSPKPLIESWLGDRVTWIKATSNSAAADMVAEGQVDLCVTTGHGIDNNTSQLRVIHNCGCPVMAFTIATPLSMGQLASI